MNRPMDLSRYQRQTIFPPVGVDGQERLLNATAVIVGCGATGSSLANLLVRAGVGRVRIIDRDFIELNNLQRQILFDEDDIAANLPKAEAAARKLRRINSQVNVEAVVADANPGNILDLISPGPPWCWTGRTTSPTRFLINDACLKLAIPWVYTGVVASYGMTATFVPEGAPAEAAGRSRGHRLSALSDRRNTAARLRADVRHGGHHRPHGHAALVHLGAPKRSS